jgi:hypothetical protein
MRRLMVKKNTTQKQRQNAGEQPAAAAVRGLDEVRLLDGEFRNRVRQKTILERLLNSIKILLSSDSKRSAQ